MNVHNAWDKVTVKSLKALENNEGDLDFLNITRTSKLRKSTSNLAQKSKQSNPEINTQKVMLNFLCFSQFKENQGERQLSKLQSN
jgi:hypothetical protein